MADTTENSGVALSNDPSSFSNAFHMFSTVCEVLKLHTFPCLTSVIGCQKTRATFSASEKQNKNHS